MQLKKQNLLAIQNIILNELGKLNNGN